MKENVRQKLKTWAENNNWTASHPLDDERFWDFVITAFKSGDRKITEEEFYSTLVDYYEDEDALTNSYITYQDGIELLDRFTKKL